MKALCLSTAGLLLAFFAVSPMSAQTFIPVTADNSAGFVGRDTSLAVVNGNPAISYWDVSNNDLKYVRGTNASGTVWGTPVTVDSVGNVGEATSLKVVNGNPAICYYDRPNGNLKYVRATDANGTAWGTPVAVVSTGDVGLYNSMQVVNGNPAIAYWDLTGVDLKFVRAIDANGAGWGAPVTIDSAGGLYISMQILPDGSPGVSYGSATTQLLKFVRATDATATSWMSPVTADTAANSGNFTSLQIVNGRPAISYVEFNGGNLKYARSSDPNGLGWIGASGAIVTNVANANFGGYASLQVVGGKAAIAYWDGSSGFTKYVVSTDTFGNGSTWGSAVTVDSAGGEHVSLQVLAAGNPGISYYDTANGNLKFAYVVAAAAPEIAVEQPVGTNIVDGGTKDFGSMAVGSNTNLTFTIKNTGTTNLTGLTITKDGVNSNDFAITASPTAPVAPGGSTTFTVQFTPAAAGARAAALHIANNDSDENPFDINLTGTGTVPEIGVEQPAGTNIADGGTKSFGSVVIGSNTSLTFTITNTGTANLTGLTITKDGANSGDFTVTASPTAPVAPNGSTTFTVQFTPGATGARAAALHVANNDSDENPFDINLTGTGTAPEIGVEQPVGTNIADGGTKSFGSVVIGSNTSLTFTITNTGTANLTGLTITKDGANSGDFTVTASPTAPVAPNGSTTFTVQFTPGATGARAAALHIANNDSDENPFDINVSGTGTAPEIGVEQPVGTNIPDGGSKDFGSVAVGTNTSLTFTITNTGTADLTGLVITKDGVNSNEFTITASPASPVASGSNTTFTVQFAPGGAGARTAVLHIANNDSDENPFDITVTGAGTAPEMAVESPFGTTVPDGGTRNFGGVAVSNSAILFFRITNSGTANLTGLTITIDGVNSNEFTITAPPTAPVAPGGITPFNVQFAPTGAGVRTAAMHIANNDSDENPYDINLSGTGTTPEIVVEQPVGANIPDGGSKGFGSVVVGANTNLTFTITNSGAANLTGLTITKDGANSADFIITASPTAPVVPGGSTTFTVQFAPGGAGARSAALHIANNDSDENPFDITVSGTGLAPEIAVEQPVGTNIADGGSKNFGSVAVGTNTSLVFTITNTGTANLTGLTITKDGVNSNDFAITVSPTAPVAPAGSTTFTVQFTPGGAGARTAALHIANNDSDENPFDITVSGTGTVPEIAVEQPVGTNIPDGGSKNFGSVVVGGNSNLTFTITNTGTGNLTGLTITKDGVNSNDFTITASPTAPVAPAGSTTYTVQFTPGAAGARTAALHIANNDSDENPFDITVSGTGTVPEIAVEQPAGTNIADGGSKNFGNVVIGSNTSLTFTITNTGTANLTGLTITKDGVNSNDFTITASPTAPVAPGASTTFTVQFTPGAAGARAAALHIANNDSDENPFDINLTGTGTAPEIAVEQPVGTNIPDVGSKDFGSVVLGGNNSLTFTITNTGTANLTGLTFTKDGANSGDFTVTASPTAPVAPNGSTTFTVQFAPGAAGSRAAALHIANNDSDENPFDINLSGTGTSTGTQAWSASSGNGNGAGNGTADTLRIRLNGGNVEFSADGGVTWAASAPISTMTNLTLNGSSDDDTFVIDLSAGNPIPSGGIFINGGAQTSAGDQLVVTGGATAIVTHSFINANDGAVTLGGNLAGTINYTGLEPITDNLIAADRIFNFNGGGETITLVNAAGAAMTIDSTLSESVTFANPTTNLTINAGTGNDTVTISSVDADGPFNAILTINGSAGIDTVVLNGDITLAAGNNLTVSAETVTIGVNADLTSSGTGTITISADSLAIDASASLNSVATVTLTPNSASTAINLGGTDAVGTLGLTDAELDRIITGTINIGDTNNGDITVSAAISRALLTALKLNSGAAITFTTGSLNSAGGDVTLNPGTAVSPAANSTDILMGSNGTLAFGSSDDLAIAINGPAADTQYRQLSVVGKVNLTGADLALSGSYTPVGGNTFTIVNNDGSDAIIGNFTGLPEGATVTFNGAPLRLTYAGGDGNDVVLIANSAPVLPTQTNQTIAELTTLIVTNTASDAETNALTYAVSGATGAAINTNGVITWTPSEAQGPGTNTLTTVVTDTGGLSATNTFTVTVSEVNLPPSLNSLSNYTVNPGQTITFTATAADDDLPTNTLSFSLVSPLVGASIDSGSGVFNWRLAIAQRDTTNIIQVRVQDDGSPSLSYTNSFTAIVNPLAPVVLTPTNLIEGQFNFSVSGTSGPDYIIQNSDNLTNWTDIATNLSPTTPFQFNSAVMPEINPRFYRVRLAP